ncbi:hypothetical protein IGI37_002580 [Enterococcus sp. AZ194]|uniref:DUF1304 domain-containing protein n=1 Tax=Enterococcus sp. AZ194 TaxID=2774629 RepID=UPI003F271FC0
MTILSIILCSLVALEHVYIFYLESLVPSSKKTAETFGISIDQLKEETIQTLIKNQGIYNLMIAVALGYTLLFSTNQVELGLLLTGFVVVVAIYGGLTSSKSIILKQGAPAMLALLSLLVW